MPIITNWIVEQRIIESAYVGEINEDDLQIMVEDIAILIEECDTPIYHITDLKQLTASHANVSRLKTSLRFFEDARIGWLMVDYGGNNSPNAQFFATTMVQVLNTPAMVFKNREGIYDFLQSMDNSLVIPAPTDHWQDAT